MAALIHQIDEIEQLEQEDPLQFKAITQVVSEVEQLVEPAPDRPRVMLRFWNEDETVAETAPLGLKAIVQLVDEVEQVPEALDRPRVMVRLWDEDAEVVEGVLHFKDIVQIIDEVEQLIEVPLHFKDILKIINEEEQVSRSAPYFVTVTNWVKVGHNDWVQKYTSDPADLLDYVEMTGLDAALTHCFLGVQMINHRGEVTFASAGTFYVQVRTVNTGLWEDAPNDHAIDGTAPDTLSFSGNIEGVRVRLTSLAGITSWRVFLTCNRR